MADLSRFGMFKRLLDKVWSWRQVPAQEQRALPLYCANSDKVFYTSSVEAKKCRVYCLALLDADRLFGDGAEEIKHGERHQYYADLL